MRALRGVALAIRGTLSLFAGLAWMELEEWGASAVSIFWLGVNRIRRMLRALR